MRKTSLRGDQMSDALYVDHAAGWARYLTMSESRGPGDIENSWRRLEARYGITFGAFWSLRYRRPKEIGASIYFRLRAAYQAECERQMRKLAHDIEVTRAIAGDAHPAVRAAQAVLDKDEG